MERLQPIARTLNHKNYGLIIGSNQFRAFKFTTNGHQNGGYRDGKWFDLSVLDAEQKTIIETAKKDHMTEKEIESFQMLAGEIYETWN